MSLLKYLGAAAVVTAAAAAIVVNETKKNKRNKELDEFFLPDEKEPVVVDVPVEEDNMEDLKADVASWLETDEKSAVMDFVLETKEKAVQFQDLLSEKGLSSNINTSEDIVEVYYSGDMNRDGLNTLILDLEEVCKSTNANYVGYHF